jgi:hydrogenase/urease accessory protein HupE
VLSESLPIWPSARRGRLALVVWASLLLQAFTVGSAWAHDETVSTSHVEINGKTVTWKVDVGLAGLGKALPLPAPEGQLDVEGLKKAAPAIGAYLSKAIVMSVNGRPLPPTLGTLEPRYERVAGGPDALSRVAQTLRYESPDDVRDVVAKIDFFGELTEQHRSILRVHWGNTSRQFVRLGQTELVLSHDTLFPSVWRVGGEFFRWGVHHIFVGYDHIAFVLALLLAVTSFRSLVITISAFTVAHSFTLLLSALGLVDIPSRLTEILIAASVVYIAAENLTRGTRTARQRWLLTFSFGLIHGLGFANELRDRLAELSIGVVWPVISFNLGVEAGQLAIVALVFPLMALIRASGGKGRAVERQQMLVRWGSVPILLLGLFWLIERMSGE